MHDSLEDKGYNYTCGKDTMQSHLVNYGTSKLSQAVGVLTIE